MIESLFIISAFGMAIAGMVGLSLTKERHFRLALPLSTANTGRQRALFWGSWLLLLLSALPSILGWGSGSGLTGWFAVLTVAALFPVVLLSYAPQWLSGLGWTGLALGLVALAAATVSRLTFLP
ncbi:MAG: DUF3325 domain-containing protein [Ectothiorhodospiraceae bacterium]|nr:DUF3325 domain-containing protein [Ectothiorhodospiraceae bacterium]MCH8506365.1 DUF3325 domain-containing protein [Ectothiorhodospiraceae bacterium]